MSGKGMLCGGNTVIMCATCDRGRKSFFSSTHFFRTTAPSGGSPPKKNIPRGIKNFSSPPPKEHAAEVANRAMRGGNSKGQRGREWVWLEVQQKTDSAADMLVAAKYSRAPRE